MLAALGVGLLTAMFAIADPYTFRPLPYPMPDRLAVIRFPREGVTPGAQVPTLDDLRAEHGLFDALAVVRPGPTLRIESVDGARALQVYRVSDDFFRIVGLPAPVPSEWQTAQETGVLPVLLTAEARRRLPGDTTRPDGLVRTDQGLLRVLGHLPEGFVIPSAAGPVRADALTALPADEAAVFPAGAPERGGRMFAAEPLPLLARLASNVEARVVRERLARSLASGGRLEVRVESLRDPMMGSARQLAWAALAAGLLVLLTCAGNVGNLMLVRAAYRMREVRTREALGASRADIARMWLVESLVLAAVAVGAGLVVTAVTVVAINRTIPAAFATLGVPAVTPRVIAFAVLAATLVVIIAFLPIAAVTFRGGGARLTAPGAPVASRRWRVLFTAMQAAMAMMLAIGAGMVLRSYGSLMTQETGFDGSTAVVTVRYPLAAGSRGELLPTIGETVAQLRRVPGVRRVGATSSMVVSSGSSARFVTIRGQLVRVDFGAVTPTFFDATGMQVVTGRGLSDADSAWRGVVVNQALARAMFADGTAIGEPVIHGGRQALIVGIVRDVFDKELDRRPTPTLYATLEGGLSSVTYVLSPGAAATGAAPSVRRAIATVNAAGVTGDIQTIDGRYDDTIRDRTFATLILTLFGLGGAAVCVMGVAGLVGFTVSRRTSEISIRMVLGAEPRQIRRMVMGDAVAAAAFGAGVGLVLGRAMSRTLEHVMYGVAPGDWVTTVAAAAVLMVTILIGALIPARRAMKLAPAAALRVE